MSGRPSKLTPEIRQNLAHAISVGATYELACVYAGIDYSTFRRWMLKGEEQAKGDHREFRDAVKRAEGEAVVRLLSIIELAAKDQWQAAAWKLERRYPESYGRRTVEVSGPEGGPIKHEGTSRQIIESPEATRIAHDLLRALAGDAAPPQTG